MKSNQAMKHAFIEYEKSCEVFTNRIPMMSAFYAGWFAMKAWIEVKK